jgi:DNA repair ATPase RecN
MIISLSQEVCQQIQEIDRLERLKNNLSSLRATLDELIRLREIVLQLKALIILQNGRLSESVIQSTKSGIERLSRDVQASADKLEDQPRQVKELTLLQRRTQDLINNLKDSWKLYAEECTRETLELHRLVSYLPEVETQQTTYQALIAHLEHYKEHIPLTPAQLTDFDECLQQLNQYLSNIEGLSTAVKKFLEKVLKDQATLANLTDEVLQWCRQGAHAQAFVVGFSRGKRG